MSRKHQEATNSSEQLKIILCWDLVCNSYFLYIGRFAVVACKYGSLGHTVNNQLECCQNTGKVIPLHNLQPYPKNHNLCALVVLICGLTMATAFMCLFSPREHKVSNSSAFRRMLASVHFVATMHLRCALLMSLHWSELLSKLLPDSQSSVTSRKCGFRGRTRWFRVPFWTGPAWDVILLTCMSVNIKFGNACVCFLTHIYINSIFFFLFFPWYFCSCVLAAIWS